MKVGTVNTPTIQLVKTPNEAPISTSKKSNRFYLPNIKSFDHALQSIRATLRLNTVNHDQNFQPEDVSASIKTGGTTETASKYPTITNMSRYQPISIPLINKAFHSIRGALWIREIEPVDTSKGHCPDSVHSMSTAVSTEIQTSAMIVKQEGIFNFDEFPFIDTTMDLIKEGPIIDQRKLNQLIQFKDSITENRITTMTETSTPVQEEVKSFGFHLPTLPSLDTTIQLVRGRLRLDNAQKEESSRSTQCDCLNKTLENLQSSIESSSAKKEGGLSLPTVAFFDDTVTNIKETLGFHATKLESTEVHNQTALLSPGHDSVNNH